MKQEGKDEYEIKKQVRHLGHNLQSARLHTVYSILGVEQEAEG